MKKPSKENSPWNDKSFIEEMDRRSEELKTGKVKGETWEQVKQKARQVLYDRKRR